jgi:hypothetical protein
MILTKNEIRRRESIELLNFLWWGEDINSEKYYEIIEKLDDYIVENKDEDLGYPNEEKKSPLM